VIFNADETWDRRRLHWLLAGTGLLAVLLVLIWWPGCRQYPVVTSEESLKLIKQLYTACNTKDSVRLAKAEQDFEKAVQDGKMTTAEKKAFTQILGLAKAGQWERAEKAAFRFAQDQLGKGSAATRMHQSMDHHPKSKTTEVKEKK
jgi:hypothetical protein